MLTQTRKNIIHVRDGYRCYYCRRICCGDGDRRPTIDHRVPKAQGGDDRYDNLVTACFACNQDKADTPLSDFIRATMPSAGKKHKRRTNPADLAIAQQRAERKRAERIRLGRPS